MLGGFAFARVAWFRCLGAAGNAIGPVMRVGVPSAEGEGIRDKLTAHIHARLEGSAGGIAPEDETAVRASPYALLSVNGLHVTAVVAVAMFLTLRLLALSSTSRFACRCLSSRLWPQRRWGSSALRCVLD